MQKSVVKFLVSVLAFLTLSGMAYGQPAAIVNGALYAENDGWAIHQYAYSESSTDPSCSAVFFEDRLDGLRIERFDKGYLYGINGLNRNSQGDQYQLDVRFGDDGLSTVSGAATFVRDEAYPSDDWLSHFLPVEEADGALLVAARSEEFLVAFSFLMLGNRTGNDEVTLDYFPSNGSRMLRLLDECYQSVSMASGPPVYPNSDCPDDGPRLAGSGVCRGRAVNFLNIVDGVAPDLMEGCDWVVNETLMPGGDYLFYLAASCGPVVSQLAFSSDATFAALSVGRTAMNGGKPGGDIITVGKVDETDPYQNILTFARDAMADKAVAARCIVRPALEPSLADELVVDFNLAETEKDTGNGPRYPCGPFGYDDEEWTFWRIIDGYAWFFDFGQDIYQDIDPRSLTIVAAADLPI